MQNAPWLFNPGQPAQPQGPAPVRRAAGGPIPGGINFQARGTDTVPAMLTPGEFVMKKSAVDKYGMGFMSAINEGRGGSGGGYMHEGGSVSQFGDVATAPKADPTIAKIERTGTATWNKMTGMDKSMKSPMSEVGAIKATTSATNQTTADIWNSFPDLNEILQEMSSKIDDIWWNSSATAGSVIGFDDEQILREISKTRDDLDRAAVRQIGVANFLDLRDQQSRRATRKNFRRLARFHGGAGPIPQFLATGGMARGADTVPAMLTPGEFVMKKSAVDKYGVGFMRGVNNGVQGFAKGGPVQYLHKGSNGAVTPTGGGGGGGGGFGDIVSSISSSLDAFNQAFLAFSGLSSMLGNIINSISNLNITHTINLQGSLNIPGFSQEAVNSIVSTIADQTADITNKQIRKALRQRDSDNENKT